MIRRKKIGIPDQKQLRAELERERRKIRRRYRISGAIEALLVAGAVTVLVSTLLAPALRVDGSSMEPVLKDGEIVVTWKSSACEKGDIIAFYHNNRLLIKRVIASGGETVSIDADGTVYVDGVLQEEAYLPRDAKAFGKCNITLPCTVPQESVFVMGDNREVSVDSRSSDIGCVAREQIVSKVAFRIFPPGSVDSPE